MLNQITNACVKGKICMCVWCVCMCMCVRVCHGANVCVYVCVCECVCVCVFVPVCVSVCVRVCVCVCIHVCVCVCVSWWERERYVNGRSRIGLSFSIYIIFKPLTELRIHLSTFGLLPPGSNRSFFCLNHQATGLPISN